MKALSTGFGSSYQPTPAAYLTNVGQPLPPSGVLPPAVIGPGTRLTNAYTNRNDGLTTKRSHVNAPLAGRVPVAATRCQDADPTANDGVTITLENGVKTAPKGSSLR